MFEGKVALVTGASSGIGLATAQRFARLGAKVVLSDIADQAGQQAAAQVRSEGAEAIYIRADVSRHDDVASLMRQIDETFGRLDFAFNNAGIEGAVGPIAESSLENWDRVIAVNLSSVFYCTREEIPLMKRNGGGVIVNCSSIAGIVGTKNSGIYGASKHGVVGLSRSAALDYALDGIRVNVVCPGVIDTAMIQRVIAEAPEMKAVMEQMEPVGRFGKPEEVAASVTWLCQPESAFVTGIIVPVDGGLTAQ
jgi:NAD(P)-dependent dehydrogenase (short-subunit alcohol dehydrogenase family)